MFEETVELPWGTFGEEAGYFLLLRSLSDLIFNEEECNLYNHLPFSPDLMLLSIPSGLASPCKMWNRKHLMIEMVSLWTVLRNYCLWGETKVA